MCSIVKTDFWILYRSGKDWKYGSIERKYFSHFAYAGWKKSVPVRTISVLESFLKHKIAFLTMWGGIE